MPDVGRPLGFAFKKSSYSGGGGCVEVAISLDSMVLVQDTKDPLRRTRLAFSKNEWAAFINGVKNGEFDFVDRSGHVDQIGLCDTAGDYQSG